MGRHGMYVTHHSFGNVIERNKFSYVSGYPVKFRISQQCASWGNRFFCNRLRGNYAGKQPSLWSLGPEGLDNPDGEQRVHTGGNIRE